MHNRTVLVTDTDPTVAECMAEALATEGYAVHCQVGARLTVEAVKQLHPDLVILEQWHGTPDALLLVDQLRRCNATRSIAVIVSATDPRVLCSMAAPLRERGCTTLLKPFDIANLLDRVADALGDG